MDRDREVVEEGSLLQKKDQQILKLQTDLSLKNSQIMNLQFCLKLRDDQVKQMRLALVESQTKKSAFLTNLQLKTRELKSATSNCKKLNQRISKNKLASGLEIAHLKSLLNTKDSKVNSLSSAKEKNVSHSERMKSKVKPSSPVFFAPRKIKEIKRNEVAIERCLPKTGAEYEMLLIRMEEGNLAPTGYCQMEKERQQSLVSDESPMKIPDELVKTVTFGKSLESVILDKPPVILEESPQTVILSTTGILVSEKNDSEQKTQKPQTQKPLTMEDLVVFGDEKASYEESLTMQQLGLFGSENDELRESVVEEEHDSNVEENVDAIDLLLRMEEGLLVPSQF